MTPLVENHCSMGSLQTCAGSALVIAVEQGEKNRQNLIVTLRANSGTHLHLIVSTGLSCHKMPSRSKRVAGCNSLVYSEEKLNGFVNS